MFYEINALGAILELIFIAKRNTSVTLGLYSVIVDREKRFSQFFIVIK